MDANMLASLTQTKKARTLRASSWDISGRNGDAWVIEGGETRVLADLNGAGLYYAYLDDAKRGGCFSQCGPEDVLGW